MSTGDRDPRRVEGAKLLSDSSLILFHRMTGLVQTLTALRMDGYHVVSLEASTWRTAQQMHAALAVALDFPAHYGNNLDALNDCLGEVAAHAYGFPADATGLVLAMTGFDHFASASPDVARALLDIFATHSRNAQLQGEQLLCLIQSSLPRFPLESAGPTPIVWNKAERPGPFPSDLVPEPPKRPWWRRSR
ncbi:barstar family protein [Actinoplanes sp. CA-252034]|uniref:barstar family protein n=1 Tax=Actinoplanes sp. CA-252034 TaxID=3239906 RepID=UPI003D9854D9